jgi:hypothetical protein
MLDNPTPDPRRERLNPAGDLTSAVRVVAKLLARNALVAEAPGSGKAAR